MNPGVAEPTDRSTSCLALSWPKLARVMKAAEHDNQYGCREGRGVEDVLQNNKYIAAIFFDEEAFDHLWWPSILRRLIEQGIRRKWWKMDLCILISGISRVELKHRGSEAA